MSESNLQRLRNQERVLHEAQSYLTNHQTIQRLHDWEQRTQKQIDQREVESIAQRLLHQEEEKLQERKHELLSLYSNEMSSWNETHQRLTTVTSEEKMEQLRARANELKAKRENERRAFVKECYERQWMESCDDIRALNSKAMLDRLTKEREIIIKNKNKAREEERQKRQAQIDMLPHIVEKEENSASIEQSQQSTLEFRQALDHQVQWKRSHEESLLRSKQLQEQEELQQLAILKEFEKESKRETIERAKRDGESMLQEIKERAKERETQQDIERNQNRILLRNIMEEDYRAIQKEQEKKDLERAISMNFIQCLQEQAKENERHDDYVDTVLNKEAERLMKVNDERVAAELQSKRQWMKELDASWQEQIRRKQNQTDNARNIQEQEITDIQAAIRREEEEQVKMYAGAKAKRMETMLDNKQRMDSRLSEISKEQQEKNRVQQQIRDEERRYQERLEEMRTRRCCVRDLI